MPLPLGMVPETTQLAPQLFDDPWPMPKHPPMKLLPQQSVEQGIQRTSTGAPNQRRCTRHIQAAEDSYGPALHQRPQVPPVSAKHI